MPMYNLIEYSENYAKTIGSVYQFHRDDPPATPANVRDSTTFKEIYAEERTDGDGLPAVTKDIRTLKFMYHLHI